MEALGIDAKLILAQMINFFIFFLIFRKFIAKPLARYLKKQEEDESKRALLTQELDTAKARLDEERKTMLREIKAEQKKSLGEAKKYADGVKADMLQEAQKQAAAVIEAGKQAVEHEKQALQKELTTYVRQTAQLAIDKGLASYLTDDKRKEITNHIIQSIQPPKS